MQAEQLPAAVPAAHTSRVRYVTGMVATRKVFSTRVCSLPLDAAVRASVESMGRPTRSPHEMSCHGRTTASARE